MQSELEKGEFVLVENDIEKRYSTILTFYNSDFDKNYVVYTDDTYSPSGNLNIYASCYNPFDSEFKLNPILSDEEWNNIDKVIDGIISNG